MKVSKANGEITSYKINGQEQFVSPLKPYFGRPPIDNDTRGANRADFMKSIQVWQNLHNKLLTKSVQLISESEALKKVIVNQGFYTLNVHLMQAPVGGTLSSRLLEYLIKPGIYNFEFGINPLIKK